MTPYFYHPAAKQELAEAVEYYESRRERLGSAFLDEVEATVQRILLFPGTWPRLSKSVRRCRTRRFPYGVLYRAVGEAIEIVAVMHLHRHPDAWTDR